MIIWKNVLGYEGKYQVSNIGEIISLPRNGTKKEIVLKAQMTDKDGYKIVKLRKNNNPKMVKVHRIVAEAFIEKTNSNIVDHINGIRDDNRVENLRWVNNYENVKFGKCGKDFIEVKFKENGIVKIFESLRQAEKETGISRYMIKKDCRFTFEGVV